MRSRVSLLSVVFLLLLYLAAGLAPFLSPYSPKQQFRESYLSPPTRIGFRDESGDWRLRPRVEVLERIDDTPQYRTTPSRVPLVFFVEGSPYVWLGMEFRIRLFGVADEAHQVFLLGSDELGRDLFSRILHGAQFSLTVGLVAILTTMAAGVSIGVFSGYSAGWFDRISMRVADLFLSLPALFVILGIRAVFPLRLSISMFYWLMVVIFTLVGWASVARVIRGQVLSLKERDYVLAARALGAAHWWILTRHILPFTTNYLVVQASVLVPAYILGEVTLSFLGVGVQEPDASWGTLLTAAASIRNMTHHPWLLSPAVLIFFTVLAFHSLGDRLKGVGRKTILIP